MDATPDLSQATTLFHHRDAALDQEWGEGYDVTLLRLPDGRLYQRWYRYHIDFDGSHDDRVVTTAEAIACVTKHGGAALAAKLFPGT